ncbi:unnamed protein product [Darwinula stevensoni]|uniref:Beta/gamma crystallin 'Greek key' domain-containing protein n=1 Tax=Darwinula stevensoni TaxID=69355 RepID=A0A7R9A1T6_9CRUS|nr:unnamed protein product [Darwinula stevensoni]CAG0878574.1 unnamed protein product [Darwinula stevensoni]
MFYSEYGYNPNDYGGMSWVWGQDYCFSFGSVSNDVSSLRYAGHGGDCRISSLTLYEHEYFSGEEFYSGIDVPSVPASMSRIDSITTTGSDWTVYTLPNYTGSQVCILAGGPPCYVALVTDLADLGISTVRSFRRGCFSERKIRLDTPHHGSVVKTRE